MVDVPQQDWCAYQTRARAGDAAWVRGLTTPERFALYEDLFDLVWASQREDGELSRLERWNWHQKLATRRQFVAAFTKLDDLERERAATNNAH